MGVSGEIARRPKAFEFRAQPRKMGVGRVHHMDLRQRQPSFELSHDIRNGEGSLDNPAVRGDAHEPRHRGPDQPDALGA